MTSENLPATRVASITEPLNRQVVSEIAISQSFGGVRFMNMVEVMDFAKMMSLSDLAVPKHLRGNPGACLAVVIQSVEMGMSPFAVANKSYIVNERLVYESAIYHAVAIRRIFKGRIKANYSGDAATRQVRLSATLTNGETIDYTSPEFAKITTKNSPLWKSDPDQQLFYYGVRAMVRRYFPDVMMGLYTDDEFDGAPIVSSVDQGSTEPKAIEEQPLTLDSLNDDAPAPPADDTTPGATTTQPEPAAPSAFQEAEELTEPIEGEQPEVDPLEEAYEQDHDSCKRTLMALAKSKPGFKRSSFDGGLFKYAHQLDITMNHLNKTHWIALHKAIAADEFDYATGKILQPA